MFRRLKSISEEKIEEEWDCLAPIRFRQISRGTDITYRDILIPGIISLLPDRKIENALDAGCGVGVTADTLAKYARTIVGIDVSGKSIAIAHKNFGDKVKFSKETLEYHSKYHKGCYDIVVCNMVLMDVPNLDKFLFCIGEVLAPGGSLIFSITHPFFWPEYYGYKDKPWYKYDKEIIIQSPFKISMESDCGLMSTHIHRSLERYMESLNNVDLAVQNLLEPMPAPQIAEKYPAPWTGPRYLFARCSRIKEVTPASN